MNMQHSETDAGMRRRQTDWGVVLAPEDLEAVQPVGMRMRRRLLAASLLAAAGAVMALPLGPGADWSLKAIPAVVLAGLGLWLLRPRRESERIEIEVDVTAGEIRVVECRGDVRTVVSHEPMGDAGAVEVGRTIVTLPGGVRAAAGTGTEVR